MLSCLINQSIGQSKKCSKVFFLRHDWFKLTSFPQIKLLLRGLGARQSSKNIKTTIWTYRQFYDFHTSQVVYKNNEQRLILTTPDFRFCSWLRKFCTKEKITKGNVKRRRAMDG